MFDINFYGGWFLPAGHLNLIWRMIFLMFFGSIV